MILLLLKNYVVAHLFQEQQKRISKVIWNLLKEIFFKNSTKSLL